MSQLSDILWSAEAADGSGDDDAADPFDRRQSERRSGDERRQNPDRRNGEERRQDGDDYDGDDRRDDEDRRQGPRRASNGADN